MTKNKRSAENKVRLIFFSSARSDIRHFEFNLKRLILGLFFTVFVTVGLFMASATISNSLDEKSDQVGESNVYLREQVAQLKDDIDRLSEKIADLEVHNEDLEAMVGLVNPKPDSRPAPDQVASTLPSREKFLFSSFAPVDFEYETERMTDYLSNLEARIRYATEVQDSIEDKFLSRAESIKNVPSIRPVVDARITDKFGNRKDPFISRVKHHNGIDLKSGYGTKVYAAASGVVELTRIRYRKNVGYGKVVIINHGHGFKTLYGHLSKVFIKRGQRVNRWDVIGLSGNTGRATGPHLHYEVWKDGRSQNPEHYILN